MGKEVSIEKSYLHVRVGGCNDIKVVAEAAEKLGLEVRFTKMMVDGGVCHKHPFFTSHKLGLDAIENGELCRQLESIGECLRGYEADFVICVQICIAGDERTSGLFFSESVINAIASVDATLDISIGLIL
mgnify:CR=1 FL=1